MLNTESCKYKKKRAKSLYGVHLIAITLLHQGTIKKKKGKKNSGPEQQLIAHFRKELQTGERMGAR